MADGDPTDNQAAKTEPDQAHAHAIAETADKAGDVVGHVGKEVRDLDRFTFGATGRDVVEVDWRVVEAGRQANVAVVETDHAPAACTECVDELVRKRHPSDLRAE